MAYEIKQAFGANDSCLGWAEVGGKFYACNRGSVKQVLESTDQISWSPIYTASGSLETNIFALDGSLYRFENDPTGVTVKLFRRNGVAWDLVTTHASHYKVYDLKIRNNKAYYLLANQADQRTTLIEFDGVGVTTIKQCLAIAPPTQTLTSFDVAPSGDIYYYIRTFDGVNFTRIIVKNVASVETTIFSNADSLRPIFVAFFDNELYFSYQLGVGDNSNLRFSKLDSLNPGANEVQIGILDNAADDTNSSISKRMHGSETFDGKLHFYYSYIVSFPMNVTKIAYSFNADQGLLLEEQFPGNLTSNELNFGWYYNKTTELIIGIKGQYEFIGETAPPEPQPGTVFIVPKIQSLQFVIEPGSEIDDCGTFKTADNTLFCKSMPRHYWHKRYYQKVQLCDLFPIQFNSDYADHRIELFRERDNGLQKSFPYNLRTQNIGQESIFDILIRNHGAGQSRVYFNGGVIPIPLQAGEQFDIINNADGFNGTYTIQSIEVDLLLSSQYLVIALNYGIAAPSSLAQGRFEQTIVPFNTYETPLSFADVPEGDYYMKITPINPDLSEGVPAISEPISLKERHLDCLLYRFRNIDNAFDIDYTTGITSLLRVESVIFKRLPSGSRQVLRNTTGELRKLVAKKYRVFLLEFFQLPPYLIEKMSCVLDHDYFSINSVAFQTEEGLSDPIYNTRYPLANATAKVEQVPWFSTYNGDDLGSIELESQFIIANDGFLKS